MVEIPDLWPKEIANDDSSLTPLSILKAQAAGLARRTKGLVTARVDRRNDDEGDFFYSFKLVAPTLNYSYELFTAWHEPIKLYPVHCNFLGDVAHCENQDHLLGWLGKVFSSRETSRVVNGLLIQAREGGPTE